MTPIEKLQLHLDYVKKANCDMVKTKRTGEEYVSPSDKKEYVYNGYVLFIGNKCLKLLSTGQEDKDSLIKKLKEINWLEYSYKWAYTERDLLCEHLMVTWKSGDKLSKYLDMQADYLWDAMLDIVECLEN